MNISAQLAQHIRQVHFGGNWTTSNMKDLLNDVSWQEATTQLYSLNTIATLVYHINYYIVAVSGVLRGEVLNAKDEYSFSHPPVESQHDWDVLISKVLGDAERFAKLVEQIPDAKFSEDFTNSKYGSYHRNLLGIIEHTHYHLGQIAVIKKMLREQAAN
ncbi:MAG: DUF1572 domain-containing protein [Bacteroidia bacterium]